jgi:hypothetical protein
MGSTATRLFRLALALGAALSVGCGGSAEQRYYLAAADLDDDAAYPKLTFYRVTIKGDSVNTKSTFQSGLYDADALHQLFGEVKKPDQGTPAPSSSSASGAGGDGGAQAAAPTLRAGTFLLRFDPASKRWETVDDNQRFAFIYGANADAIAEQIRLFGESETTGQQMARLFAAAAAGETFVDLEQERDRAAADAKSASALAAEFDKLVAEVAAANATPADVREALLKAAQAAAKAAGSTETFDPADLDKAFEKAQLVHDTLAKRGG